MRILQEIRWWWSDWWGTIVGISVASGLILLCAVSFAVRVQGCEENLAGKCKARCLQNAPDDRVEQCMEMCDGGKP